MKNRKIVRKLLFSGILGIVIVFCYVGGKQLDIYDSINFYDKVFYLKWLGFFVPTTIIVYGIFSVFKWMETRIRLKKEDNNSSNRVLFFGGMIFLFVCWLIVLLSLFPGAFSYDAYDEWQQVKTGMLTAHHPVLHVLILGGMVEGVYALTESYNAGIAMYSIMQMLVLAGILSYSVCFLKEIKTPKPVRIFALIYYGISPVIGLFSINATKDVLYSAFGLLFFIYIIRIISDKERFFDKRSWKVGFVVSALGTMIFRNNGLYVVLVMLAILVFICRQYLKKYLVLVVFILLPYLIYTGPVYKVLDVQKGGIQEMLSVPIQQMARAYNANTDKIAVEDIELLYKYIPKENLEMYNSTLSDPVKKDFNVEYFSENKEAFFKLWLKLGKEYPLTYINSFLTNTVDFWYPNGVVDGYKEVYGKSSYFDYRVAPPGEEKVYFRALHDLYYDISWDKETQSKPFAFMLLNPGWYFVCILVMVGYFLYDKRYGVAIASLVFVLNFLTVLLGPIALVRYVLIFYMGIWHLFALCFIKQEE